MKDQKRWTKRAGWGGREGAESTINASGGGKTEDTRQRAELMRCFMKELGPHSETVGSWVTERTHTLTALVEARIVSWWNQIWLQDPEPSTWISRDCEMGVHVCTPTGGWGIMPSKSQCGLEADYGRGTAGKRDHKAMGLIMNKMSNNSTGSSSVMSPAHTIAVFCTHRGPGSSLMSQVPSVSESHLKAGLPQSPWLCQIKWYRKAHCWQLALALSPSTLSIAGVSSKFP